MIKDPNDINDDEIRIIGQDNSSSESEGNQDKDSGKHDKRKRIRKKIWITASLAIALLVLFIVTKALFSGSPDIESDPRSHTYGPWIKAKDSCLPTASLNNAEIISFFEDVSLLLDRLSTRLAVDTSRISQWADTTICGVEIQDTTINDVPLRIYIPHGARPELHVGLPDPEDSTILYIAQAAEVRSDNGQIVGAFVLRGEPIAWGGSKDGFCAIIDGRITLGTATSTPYFEKATETGGDFFRQYPIVHEGVPVENKTKNKSIRRALCEKTGEIFVIESRSNESLHDFTQAIVDLGIQEAIGLAGGSAYGWVIDAQRKKTTFGTPVTNSKYMANYLLWRRFSGNH